LRGGRRTLLCILLGRLVLVVSDDLASIRNRASIPFLLISIHPELALDTPGSQPSTCQNEPNHADPSSSSPLPRLPGKIAVVGVLRNELSTVMFVCCVSEIWDSDMSTSTSVSVIAAPAAVASPVEVAVSCEAILEVDEVRLWGCRDFVRREEARIALIRKSRLVSQITTTATQDYSRRVRGVCYRSK
jgi:hypothetical protein